MQLIECKLSFLYKIFEELYMAFIYNGPYNFKFYYNQKITNQNSCYVNDLLQLILWWLITSNFVINGTSSHSCDGLGWFYNNASLWAEFPLYLLYDCFNPLHLVRLVITRLPKSIVTSPVRHASSSSETSRMSIYLYSGHKKNVFSASSD